MSDTDAVCHCGLPVNRNGMCAVCADARCDAYPMECPMRNHPAASSDASEPLTEAERRWITDWWQDVFSDQADVEELTRWIIRTLAARETKVRADERERIAQAIEEASEKWPKGPSRADYAECARIARGVSLR